MSRPDLVIRRGAIDRDLDGILAIDALTFTNPWTREMYERDAGRSDVSRLYVACSGEPGPALVGYCAVWVIYDEVHINNLAVLPDWRRRGVARALLEVVLGETASDGAPDATLEVRRSNDAALKLYEGLGFVVEGVRHKYYSQPIEDALVLWKRGSRGATAPAGRPSGPPDPVP